jgi:phosphatidylglycerol:prolipoprotein diacylglycerol transferase
MVKSPRMETFYLHRLSPFLVEFGSGSGIGVRWYGLSYVLSFLLANWLLVRLARRGLAPIAQDKVGDFITWAALFGVLLGGRLGFVLLYDLPHLLAEPLSLLRVWEGGMASHGGILGLVFYTLYYARANRLSWTGIGDALVCVAPPGIFLVRLANFINGELYGREARVNWAVQFPTEISESPALLEGTAYANLQPDLLLEQLRSKTGADPAGLEAFLRSVLPPRHPSQIYEALLEGALLFAILWVLRTRFRLPTGVVTGAFFVFYALLRIVGEQFRQPEDFNFGMPRGVFLSLFLVVLGICFAFFGWRRGDYLGGGPAVSADPAPGGTRA